MSTILEALKRLESVRQKEEVRQIPASMKRSTVSYKAVGGWKNSLFIAGLAIFCCVATIVWVSYGLHSQFFFRKAPPEVPVKATMPVGGFEDAPSTSHVRERPVAESAQTSAVQASTTPKQALHERAKISTSTSLSAIPPIYAKNINNKIFSKEAFHTRAVSEDISPSVKAPAYTTTQRTPKDSLHPLSGKVPDTDAAPITRGELQLQAISWSDVPTARVTVIDGRILRESQSIGGYIVIQILPDSVIVSRGGKNWKLEYDIQ